MPALRAGRGAMVKVRVRASSPDGGAELRHHSVHCRLRQAALPLQQLLAVAAADELEAQRHLVRGRGRGGGRGRGRVGVWVG